MVGNAKETAVMLKVGTHSIYIPPAAAFYNDFLSMEAI